MSKSNSKRVRQPSIKDSSSSEEETLKENEDFKKEREKHRYIFICITNTLCCLWWFDDDRCLNVINCILTILNLKSLPYIFNILKNCKYMGKIANYIWN